MIVAPYIGILAVFAVVLAIQVVVVRRREVISIGDGGNKTLERRMRAFGNFSEYAPILIGVMIAAELNGAANWQLHLVGVMAILGRWLHAVAFQDVIKTMKWHLTFRQPGMLLTFASLIIGAALLIF